MLEKNLCPLELTKSVEYIYDNAAILIFWHKHKVCSLIDMHYTVVNIFSKMMTSRGHRWDFTSKCEWLPAVQQLWGHMYKWSEVHVHDSLRWHCSCLPSNQLKSQIKQTVPLERSHAVHVLILLLILSKFLHLCYRYSFFCSDRPLAGKEICHVKHILY